MWNKLKNKIIEKISRDRKLKKLLFKRLIYQQIKKEEEMNIDEKYLQVSLKLDIIELIEEISEKLSKYYHNLNWKIEIPTDKLKSNSQYELVINRKTYEERLNFQIQIDKSSKIILPNTEILYSFVETLSKLFRESKISEPNLSKEIEKKIDKLVQMTNYLKNLS